MSSIETATLGAGHVALAAIPREARDLGRSPVRDPSPAPRDDRAAASASLTHLDWLEAEAIHILR